MIGSLRLCVLRRMYFFHSHIALVLFSYRCIQYIQTCVFMNIINIFTFQICVSVWRCGLEVASLKLKILKLLILCCLHIYIYIYIYIYITSPYFAPRDWGRHQQLCLLVNLKPLYQCKITLVIEFLKKVFLLE